MGRIRAHKRTKKGRGKMRSFNNKIDLTNGLLASLSIGKLPKTENTPKSKNSVNLCKDCFQKIGKGIKHPNNCKRLHKNLHKNIMKIVENTADTSQEKVASTIIKNKIQKENNSKSLIIARVLLEKNVCRLITEKMPLKTRR